MSARYIKPRWYDTYVVVPFVTTMTRLGVSVWGSRVLRVRGRKSGELRSTPVNQMSLRGSRYLVAARGETHWVRNVRVAPEAELLLGRRVERVRLIEIGAEDEKITILREYLRRWKFEVGQFFSGVSADSPESELRRIAPDHPVFLIQSSP